MAPGITPNLVREFLNYDPNSGIFTWRSRGKEHFASKRGHAIWNGRYAGKPAGCLHTGADGYQSIYIAIFRKKYKAHRIAWMWMLGEQPPEQIDHINRDGRDNRWKNLRASNQSENKRNMSRRIDNTSGVTGVRWNARIGKWMVQPTFNGKQMFIGYYDDIESAELAIKNHHAKNGFSLEHGAMLAHYHS